MTSPEAIDAFIERWRDSGGGETANFQSFADELCNLLQVPCPDPSVQDDNQNAYVFEKSVYIDNGDGTRSTLSADLYKAGCFVCEAKQGSNDDQQTDMFSEPGRKKAGFARRGTAAWDRAMIKARTQADRYARHLGWPPFLIVVDVGHVIELYADFSGNGQNGYVPFPDPASHRLALDDLHREEVRERLAKIWTDPQGLDPAKHAARVTREVAAKLAELAKSLESGGRAPASVAEFLMRCLFTMFAEDVELLPRDSFTELLKDQRDNLPALPAALESLWQSMDKGRPNPLIKGDIREFNGALFRNATAIPLTAGQLDLLIEAARADWSHVEPAIFGTLLERALDPRERHKLGAYYTPRAYVERLVMPTIIEPLRDEWAAVQATAMKLEGEDKHKEALDELRAYHRRLCRTRVLDPACGSGNFLYVTLEHMKRLEGEVIDVLAELDAEAATLELDQHTVTPEQFLGIEVNERAAVIAEMVLWIGFLQWHFRTSKRAQVPVPVLKNYGNIECRDAVLAWDERRIKRDAQGKPVTHWDGRTTKTHPVTGKEVPDEAAQVEDYEHVNPRPAKWPEADYVVGNPPYIGSKRLRAELGNGYVEAVRRAYPDIPGTSDYVIYWWDKAARLVRNRAAKRFGLITTNSLYQSTARSVLEKHLEERSGLSLAFAIRDHPWVDASLGAGVRVAMTVGQDRERNGILAEVISETDGTHEGYKVSLLRRVGKIGPNLNHLPDVAKAPPLRSNLRLCWQGCKLVGNGFQIDLARRESFIRQNPDAEGVLPSYISGGDLTRAPKERYVIDLYGHSLEDAKLAYPELVQHLMDYVQPERSHNRDQRFRDQWWLFGRPRPEMRVALAGLSRYVATSEVSKHRTFAFLKWPEQLIDGGAVAIASDCGFILAVLSSRCHIVWALAAGGRLEDRPRYNYTVCFDPFPFPDPQERLKFTIRALGEELDSHRKARQGAYPKLTMTQMYNVLEALREGRALTEKEKEVHDKGLVSVLKDIHDRLDAAVIEAYGWPADISDEEILERLVALNRERAEEEAKGKIRWLRPDYQNPTGAAPKVQDKLDVDVTDIPVAAKAKWPGGLPDQMKLLRSALDSLDKPLTADQIAAAFKGARRKRVEELLETLVSLGQARVTEERRYTVQ